MVDDPTTAGGATGEPAAPEAVSSPTSQEAAPAPATPETAPDPRAELYKQLESIDPRELPDNIRTKLELPFLQQYGKKTSELDTERQKLLGFIERLMPQNGPEQPDEKARLREEINNGNFGAIETLVDKLVAERTGPTMDYISKTRAIAEAAEMMPELPKYEKEVAAALQADPALLRLATIDNRAYASRVLAGLGWSLHAQALAQELAQTKANVEAAVKKGIEEYQTKLRGLPSSTSQAGKSPTMTPSEKPMTFREAFDKAWEEQKGA